MCAFLPSRRYLLVHLVADHFRAWQVQKRNDRPREAPECRKTFARRAVRELDVHRAVQLPVRDLGRVPQAFRVMLVVHESKTAEPVEASEPARRAPTEAAMTIEENENGHIHRILK